MKENILIVMSPFISHLIPTFKLASLFKDRGYNVIYVSTIKFERIINESGFLFQSSSVNFPDNSFLKVEELIPYILKKYSPITCLIEVPFWNWALHLKGLDQKFMMIQTWPCDNRAANLLPTGYRLLKEKGIISFLKNEISWIKHNKKNKQLLIDTKINEHYNQVLRLAKLDLKREYITKHNRIGYYKILDTTELILFPKELDVPRKIDLQTRFIGPFVDVKRSENKIDWTKIENCNQAIIYCSLGSLSSSFKHRTTFYLKMIEAFRIRQDLTLIMSVGDFLKNGLKDISVPKNIHLYEFAPQLEILKKASVFITHGGAGSMKESIHLGVPMLVYPWQPKSDMFGNADRVHFHKIGTVGDIENDTSEIILDRINLILNSKLLRNNLTKMQTIFKNYEDKEQQEIDFILDYNNY